MQVGVHRRVEVARPGAHHQTLQGREAHRRVDRVTAADGRGRGSVAQVQDDQVGLLDGLVRGAGPPPRSRSRGRCRGSHSGGCRTPRATVPAPHRCRPPAARSGGTRCRTPQPGVRRGTAGGRRRCPPGWRGCATEPAAPARSRQRPGRRLRASALRIGLRRGPRGDRSPRFRRPASDGPCSSNASSAARNASSKFANGRSTAWRPSAVVCTSRPLPSPIRSTAPDAGATPVSPSTRLYLSDEEPALTTRTWELTTAPAPGSR